MRIRLLLAVLAGALLLAACGPEPIQRQPVSGDDGLHLTGRLEGGNVAVSVGEPEVLLGSCTPDRPGVRELCIAGRTIAGEVFGIVVPAEHLVAGETVPIRVACAGPGCAEVEIRRGFDRIAVESGELVVREAGPRYSARFTFQIGTGTLTGAFDVSP